MRREEYIELRGKKFSPKQPFEVWKFKCPTPSVMRERGYWDKVGVFTAMEIAEWYMPPILCKDRRHLEERKETFASCGISLMYPVKEQ